MKFFVEVKKSVLHFLNLFFDDRETTRVIPFNLNFTPSNPLKNKLIIRGTFLTCFMFSAAPVLFVLSIMLSLNIIGAKPIRPWWSWENSAFIYIYFILFIILMIMYLSVLTITIPKLKFIKQKLQRKTPISMNKR